MIPAVRHRDRFPKQSRCMADFPDVRVPNDIQPGPIGPWVLDRVPAMIARGGEEYIAQRGYWSGFDSEKCFWRLYRDGQTWMTTSRMERESHSVHLKHAKGLVVMAGVGMGLFLFNLCRKPDVKRIVAVDTDEDLLTWCRVRAKRWRGGDKIDFVCQDARTITRSYLSKDLGIQEPPDYLYVDIWPSMDPECAVPDVRTIQHNVMPKTLGWWTQELSFVRWCAGRLIPKDKIDLNQFDRWCIELDMVVPERSNVYLKYCLAAALQTSLR